MSDLATCGYVYEFMNHFGERVPQFVCEKPPGHEERGEPHMATGDGRWATALSRAIAAALISQEEAS